MLTGFTNYFDKANVEELIKPGPPLLLAMNLFSRQTLGYLVQYHQSVKRFNQNIGFMRSI